LGNLFNANKARRQTCHLWKALDPNNTQSLRERAEVLVSNPDLAVWLSFQVQHDAELKMAKEREALRESNPYASSY
jgi:hypothetical protein